MEDPRRGLKTWQRLEYYGKDWVVGYGHYHAIDLEASQPVYIYGFESYAPVQQETLDYSLSMEL